MLCCKSGTLIFIQCESEQDQLVLRSFNSAPVTTSNEKLSVLERRSVVIMLIVTLKTTVQRATIYPQR